MPLLRVSSLSDDALISRVRVRQRAHRQGIPLRRRRGAGIHIIRKLIRPIFDELALALEHVQNRPHVLFQKFAHLLRLLLRHIAPIHRLPHDGRRRPRARVPIPIVTHHHSRHRLRDRPDVDVSSIRPARVRHALGQKKRKPKSRARGVRRAKRRLFRFLGQRVFDARSQVVQERQRVRARRRRARIERGCFHATTHRRRRRRSRRRARASLRSSARRARS